MSEEGVRYRCSKCKQSITVFVVAKVRCTNCGKVMRVTRDEEK